MDRSDGKTNRCPFCGSADRAPHSCSLSDGGWPVIRVQTMHGCAIESLDDWRRLAPPKWPDRQWKPGRSALELARRWVGQGHDETAKLFAILDTCELTRGFREATAIPECVTPIDSLGEGRNHDLVVFGCAAGRRVLVTMEAKADEPFGPMVGERLAEAARGDKWRQQQGIRPSRVPERVDGLFRLVFGHELREDDKGIRYQLLNALAGTYLEARLRGADVAVMLVHEFVTPLTEKQKRAKNLDDLRAFIAMLPGGTAYCADRLAGPIRLAGADPVIPVLVGKIQTDTGDRVLPAIDEIVGRPKTVRIPIRHNGGAFHLPSGQPLPRLRDGAYGELTVAESAVSDRAALRTLQADAVVQVLPAGTSLLVRVNSNRVPDAMRSKMLVASSVTTPGSWFVELVVEAPVWLRLRGTKQAALEDVPCRIPSLENKVADSINHAYSVISEAFEPSRRSRGGNVFREVFFRKGNLLIPLDDLRQEAAAWQ